MPKMNNEAYVVRGGVCAAETLIKAQERDPQYHISVNSANGYSVKELCKYGPIEGYKKVSVTTVGNIRLNKWEVISSPIEDPLPNPVHASIECFGLLDSITSQKLSTLFETIFNPLFEVK
ncbi:hypothetical protein A8F94_05460 [Bacillus sp. FJAT-27225]|uniref:hypothetical protein n=1 Tax=Bacillus sp. FJAT-27225 TaxID=1743144 RepID=UPI00080C2E26|nr:hypothetical protein [Bacillus sp. FJAT-27225]OCA91308.1 hypothetical protein A8F94_05460 [Bacillus sp. FJAT-27225]